MLLQYEKLQGFEIKPNNQIDPHRVVRIVKSKESLQLAKVVHCKIIDAVMRLSLFKYRVLIGYYFPFLRPGSGNAFQ